MNPNTSILIHPLDKRQTALPLGRPEWMEMYYGAMRLMWYPWDIKLANEHAEFTRLDASEQKIVKYILGFFANSDKLVNDNIENRFTSEIEIYEAGLMYDFQKVMENIHNVTYSNLLETIIQNPTEREFYSNAAINIPTVRAMAEWITRCQGSEEMFSVRLLRMMIVEGVFFVSCFVYIYWLASRGKMSGLCQSNELIARDEDIHTKWGAELFRVTTLRPSREELERIVREGVLLAQNFAREILTGSKLGFEPMCRHIEARADKVLGYIGEAPVFGSKSEFTFMLNFEMANQTDFFHRDVTEYTLTTHDADTGEVNVDF